MSSPQCCLCDVVLASDDDLEAHIDTAHAYILKHRGVKIELSADLPVQNSPNFASHHVNNLTQQTSKSCAPDISSTDFSTFGLSTDSKSLANQSSQNSLGPEMTVKPHYFSDVKIKEEYHPNGLLHAMPIKHDFFDTQVGSKISYSPKEYNGVEQRISSYHSNSDSMSRDIDSSFTRESNNQSLVSETPEDKRRRKQKVPKKAIEPTTPELHINTSTPNNPVSTTQEAITDDVHHNATVSDAEFRAKIYEHFQLVAIQAYKCKVCPFISTEVNLLNNHLEESHQISQLGMTSNHVTSNCINNLSYSPLLSSSNLEDNPIYCGECGKPFSNKKNLGSHVRAVHLQIRNHVCKICNKGFFKPNMLKRHEQTHKNELPFNTVPTYGIERATISYADGQMNVDPDLFVECTPDIISQNSCSSNNSIKSDSENEMDYHRVDMMQKLLQQRMFAANKFNGEEQPQSPRPKKGGYVKKVKPFTEYILQEGPEDFTCTWCSKKFVKKYSCGKHIRAVHFVERRHICQHCQKGFFLRKYFDIHINSRHHSVEENCQTCESTIFQTAKLKVKRRSIKECIIVEKDGNFACKECLTKFEKWLSCVRHIRLVHFGQQRHLCKHCQRGFFKNKNLINHINTTHHNVQEYCHECQSKPEVKPVFKIEGGQSKVSDYLYQEDEDNFICTGCEKKFTKKVNCIMHIRAVHAAEKKHCCQHCPRRFFGSGLRKHVNSAHHSILDECQDCNFTLRKSVSTHPCALCSLSFPLKMLAKDHLKTHSTTCEHCSEQFDHIDKLVDHVNDFHRKTNHPCVPCNKTFVTEQQLVEHNNTIHLVIKKEYPCPECDQSFSKEHGLLSHIGLIHRKFTSNVCEVCHAVLSNRKTLHKHMRFTHGPKNFACEKCYKAFARKDHLEKHSKRCKGVLISVKSKVNNVNL